MHTHTTHTHTHTHKGVTLEIPEMTLGRQESAHNVFLEAKTSWIKVLNVDDYVYRSKPHKRLKEHFLIRQDRTKRAIFRGSPLKSLVCFGSLAVNSCFRFFLLCLQPFPKFLTRDLPSFEGHCWQLWGPSSAWLRLGVGWCIYNLQARLDLDEKLDIIVAPKA